MDLTLNDLQPALLGLTGVSVLSNLFPKLFDQLKLHPRLAKLLGIVVVLRTIFPTLYSQLEGYWQALSSYGVSKIEVQSDDVLFPHLKRWLSQRRVFYLQKNFGVSSKLKQYGVIKDLSGEVEKGPDGLPLTQKPGSWISSDGLQYDPRAVFPLFFYKRRLFFLATATMEIEEFPIVLKCLGRSTDPLHEILKEAICMYQQSRNHVTVVQRPDPRQYYDASWQRVSEKSQRSIESVNLDSEQKQLLLDDMDEYVAGKTASWYKAHSVPYRRGYLFWGPPGCGKSSMALALAGRYQCDIYMLSLRDAGMTDTKLLGLLKILPPRALVLLEDIDSAGLKRESGGNYHDDSYDMDDDYDEYGNNRGRNGTNVTLSGLLNAIDGVDAPEGHILIMTSNTPEELDEALVRSGRISVKIGFKKATPALGKEMFIRMYHDVHIINPQLRLTSDEIERLADCFAASLPTDELSLADLQDYMLTHKSEPYHAAEQLVPWMEKKAAQAAEEQAKKQEKAEKLKKARERARRLRKKREEEEEADSDEGEEGNDEEVGDEASSTAVDPDSEETKSISDSEPEEETPAESKCQVM